MRYLSIPLTIAAFAFSVAAQGIQPTSGPLTDQRIIELVRAGVRADELARMIATAPQIIFDLTPAATDAMMKAGVSEDTIKAMAAREQGTDEHRKPMASQQMYQQPDTLNPQQTMMSPSDSGDYIE